MSKPQRGCRRLLTQAVTKGGVRITIRLGPREAKALGQIAAEEGATLSEILRDGLYQTYGIGELAESAPKGGDR